MTKIHIIALYPAGGVAAARRRYSPGYAPVGPPWPPLAVGETVTALDSQGWSWTAEIHEIDAATETAQLRIIGERAAQPMPEYTPGQPYRLPNMSGHAHTRSWKMGSIVQIIQGGPYYRVARKPKLSRSGSEVYYDLEPATAEQYATRPGSVRMPNRSAAERTVGSAVAVGDEWLHVTDVAGRPYGSAEGEHFGTTYYGRGRYVSAALAQRLNAAHARAAEEREWDGGDGLRARDAYDAAVAAIPTDYLRRHGATLGGEWRIDGHGGTEPAVGPMVPPLEWRQVATKHRPGRTPGTVGQTWRIYTAQTDYGTVYQEQYTAYDDYRTTVWGPAPLMEQLYEREIAARGITPESARAWLAEYRGCVGSELYEWAAREGR